MSKKILLPIIVFVCLLGVWVTPTAAVPPQRLTEDFGEFSDIPFVDCAEYGYDFTILVSGHGYSHLTLYFDQEGNIIRMLQKQFGTQTFENSVTGKSITTDFNLVCPIDWEENTFRWLGSLFHITVPGIGLVYLDAGHYDGIFWFDENGYLNVEIVDFHGPKKVANADYSDFCYAMSLP